MLTPAGGQASAPRNGQAGRAAIIRCIHKNPVTVAGNRVFALQYNGQGYILTSRIDTGIEEIIATCNFRAVQGQGVGTYIIVNVPIFTLLTSRQITICIRRPISAVQYPPFNTFSPPTTSVAGALLGSTALTVCQIPPPGGVKSRPARRGQRQNPREKERRNPFFHFVLLAPGPAGKSSIFLYYNRSSAKKQAKSPRFSPRGRIFMRFPCGKTSPGPRGPATGTAAG